MTVRHCLIFLVLIASLFALGTLCIDRVALVAVKWQLGRTFGVSPTYTKSHSSGRKVSLEGVKCGERFSADKLEVRIEWRRWPFHCRTLVRGGTFYLDQPLAIPHKLSKTKIPLTWEVSIIDGELLLPTGRLAVEGAIARDEQLTLLGNLSGEKGSLSLALNQGRLALSMEELDCELMSHLLPAERPWQALGGEITGEISVHFPKVGGPYFDGVAMVSDLEIYAFDQLQLHLPRSRLMFQADGTMGTLRLLDPGRITSDGESWEIENLTGGAVLHSDTMTLACSGDLNFGRATCPLEAVGRSTNGDLSLDLTWRPEMGAPTYSQFRLSEREFCVELENLGSEHAALLRGLARLLLPDLEHLSLEAGTLSATVKGELDVGRLRTLSIEKLSGEQITFVYPPMQLLACCEKVKGNIHTTMRRGMLLHNLSGDIQVEGGLLEGPSIAVEQLMASVKLAYGQMQQGTLSALCEGLFATAKLDPLIDSGRLVLELSGEVEALAHLLPSSWSPYLLPRFDNDTFELVTNLWREGPSLVLEGICDIDPARLPFSARLRSGPQRGNQTHPLTQPMHLRPWAQFLLNLTSLQPTSLLPDLPHTYWLANAEVRGHHLNADKYLAPVLLPSPRLNLTGNVNLIARYDGQHVITELEGRGMHLHSPLFDIRLPLVGNLRTDAPAWHKAFHTVDLNSGHQILTLPIQKGTYIEKKTGLEFKDIRCHLEMRDDHFEITDVETLCEEVAFQGEIALRCPPAGPSDLILFAPHIKGDIVNVGRIMEQICPLPIWSEAMAGTVTARGHGLDLRILFGEERPQVFASVEGHIDDGCWRHAHHTSLDLSYTHAERRLVFTSVHGQLASLPLQNGTITLPNLPHGAIAFDLSCGPIARLCGSLHCGELTLTPTSHLGNIQFGLIECHPGRLLARPRCDLATLADDLSYLGYHLPQTDASGQLELLVEQKGETWNIEAVGHNIASQGHTLDSLTIEGVMEGNQWRLSTPFATASGSGWTIEQCTFPTWSFSGTLEPAAGALRISSVTSDLLTLPFDSCTLVPDGGKLHLTGAAPGLALDLTGSPRTWTGTLDFNASTAPFLPPSLASFAQRFRLDSGLQLRGDFFLSDAPRFEGEIIGHQLSLLGYRWQNLSADLTLEPHQLAISNLTLSDPAGHFQINRIDGSQEDGRWSFQVPLVRFQNLRPSQLRPANGRPQTPRPFLITSGEAHHIVGDSSGKNSWTGLGSLSFLNPPRRDPTGTPFELPDQILGRLGLDFGGLVPSHGTIAFHIHDGRMVLSEFEDVFSRQRRSQFFLADDAPSYIDLDGRLNLRIRTKQHNLLLKLTESLTIGVVGTLDNPQFKLERIPRQRPDILLGVS